MHRSGKVHLDDSRRVELGKGSQPSHLALLIRQLQGQPFVGDDRGHLGGNGGGKRKVTRIKPRVPGCAEG